MNIAEVMDDLGEALKTIAGLRVFPYWAERVTPPAAVVGWPDPLEYDATYGRGSDRLELPVIVMTGKVDARSARDGVAAYANGSGAKSVKAVVEAYETTAWHTARVTQCEFGFISVAGTEYLAATFTIELIGAGA